MNKDALLFTIAGVVGFWIVLGLFAIGFMGVLFMPMWAWTLYIVLLTSGWLGFVIYNALTGY